MCPTQGRSKRQPQQTDSARANAQRHGAHEARQTAAPPDQPLIRAHPIARAALRFVVVFGLLAAPWPGGRQAYSTAFRWVGNKLFAQFGEGGIVEFLPAQRPNRTADTEITTKLEGSPYLGVDEISPRLMGFLPAVELVAFILVSGVAWRRRWLALLAGLLVLHGVLYLRLWLLIRVYFSTKDTPWQQYHPGPTAMLLLKHANEVINTAPTAGFIVPVLIWIAVTFRYSDWERIIRRPCSVSR